MRHVQVRNPDTGQWENRSTYDDTTGDPLLTINLRNAVDLLRDDKTATATFVLRLEPLEDELARLMQETQ